MYGMVFLHRDGVSEGQFYQVLLYELDAIRKVRVTSNKWLVLRGRCLLLNLILISTHFRPVLRWKLVISHQ